MKTEELWQAALLHDLKNQVGSILVQAQVLAEDLQAPEAADLATGVIQAARQAQALLARLASPGLTEQDLEGHAVVQGAVETWHPGVPVVVHGTGPCPLRGDPVAVQQILGNLLINASEAMAGRGTVDVHLAPGRIVVHDGGPGVPPERLPGLFEPCPDATGRGLGLAGAHLLAERMGGTLRLLPSDTGACFELALPV